MIRPVPVQCWHAWPAGWVPVPFASGDDAKLSTTLYSEVLSEEYLSERGWSAINDYLNPRIGVLDFLVASKAILPQLYTINVCYLASPPTDLSGYARGTTNQDAQGQ